MTNSEFWKHIDTIITQGFNAEGLKQLEQKRRLNAVNKNMQNSLFQGGLFINDFHRSNSMAAQREVAIMLLHPYSREQVLTQVASLRRKAVSKESENAQRRRQLV